MGRAGLIVDQRELAEVRAGLEHAEDDLAAVLADQHDLGAALAQDVQGVARIALEEDDAALRVGALARQLGELGQLVTLQPAEHGNAGEEIGGLGCHGRMA